MTIYGVSQSTGAERRLKVERGAQGLVLTIADHPNGSERKPILVQSESLLTGITEPTPGGTTVEGNAPSDGSKMKLAIEVRRNEVWLTLQGSADAGDIAVGLDDFQDALEGVMVRS